MTCGPGRLLFQVDGRLQFRDGAHSLPVLEPLQLH